MGIIGAIYHGIKGGYKILVDDSYEANHELDKAIDSLHRTVIDPIGIEDIGDITDDISGEWLNKSSVFPWKNSNYKITKKQKRKKIITQIRKFEDMRKVKELRGLKCPNHEYLRDNHNFMYEETYPGARPLSSTRCIKCGYTMSLHKVQK